MAAARAHQTDAAVAYRTVARWAPGVGDVVDELRLLMSGKKGPGENTAEGATGPVTNGFTTHCSRPLKAGQE